MLTITEAVTGGYENIVAKSDKATDEHRAKRVRLENDSGVKHAIQARSLSPLVLTTEAIDDEIEPDEPLSMIPRRKSSGKFSENS